MDVLPFLGMLRSCPLLVILLVNTYCASLELALHLFPLAVIAGFAGRARESGHEYFVAMVRLTWSLLPLEFLEYAERERDGSFREEEEEDEGESCCVGDEMHGNLTCGWARR